MEGLTARGHDCIQIRTKPPYLGDARQLAQLVRFRPDILHYVPGPSTLSLFGLRLLRFLYPRSAVVVSATQPRVGALVQQVRGVQVLLVGSPPAPQYEWTSSAMRDAGCLVRTGFCPRIGEIYALADCYLFPVISAGNAVELPLSVLEAMSVNLPVVSTPFGALPDLFAEGSGVFYANGGHAMAEAYQRLYESVLFSQNADRA